MKVIETNRLFIRPFVKDDLDLIEQLYSSETIMKYMPGDLLTHFQCEQKLEKILSDWKQDPVLLMEMAVLEKKTGCKIGRASIRITPDNDEALIGWLLLEPFWHQGYATEITRALLLECFKALNLHRVSGLCHPENIGSWKVMKKCGMKLEGHYDKRRKYVKHGRVSWENELELAILNPAHQ